MLNYGYICFAYSKNEWIAKAIAWFTSSEWSHSFITIPPILDKEMVMEAGGGGVSTILFEKAYRHNPNQKYKVFKFKCSQESIDKAILRCLENLEDSYGFLQYPWFIWRSINKFFGRDIKKQNNWSNQGEVCSDLTRYFIETANYKELFKDFGTNSANAQDVYEIVLAHPELFELIEERN